MIIHSYDGIDQHEDLKEQARNSAEKRSTYGNPVEFLKWVAEALRRHRTTYKNLMGTLKIDKH